MIFRYDRKGVPDQPEVYIFQDLLDTPRALREMGKVLEPHFHVFYFYLPEPLHWLRPDAISEFQILAREEIYPLLEESDEKKLVIAGGMSFSFWREIFFHEDSRWKKVYLTNPHWDLLGSVGTFLEIFKHFSEKQGFFFFDLLRLQPIAHHLSYAQNKKLLKPVYPIHFLHSERPRDQYIYETKSLLAKYPGSEWSRFEATDPESIKKSGSFQRFLLLNLNQDSQRKEDVVWADVLKIES